MTTKATHTAPPPFTHHTHPGTYQTCTHDHCTSHRTATAVLREDQPLSPAEEAAAQAIRDAKWILWHAQDRDLAVALILSRDGLLRDKAHEEHTTRFGAANAAAVEHRRRADQLAITALSGLAEEAAAFLEDGADPQQVAAQLRKISASILARRDRRAAPATTAERPGDDSPPPAPEPRPIHDLPDLATWEPPTAA